MPTKQRLLQIADQLSGFTVESILAQLEESQFWPVDRLKELQTAHLRALLSHAAEHVPFYKDLFRASRFEPRAVATVQDIGHLPTLTKSQIMEHQARFVSNIAPSPRVLLQTSGSTGVPLRFVRTRVAQSYKIASRLRFRGWYGVRRGDPQLIITGARPAAMPLRSKLKYGIHQFATGRSEVFASEMEDAQAQATHELIEHRRVSSIIGYPTGLLRLADYFVRSGKRPHHLKGIFTSGETMYDWMRTRIQAGFGVAPRNDYVATEGAIAQECPKGGLHVNMEECLVEILPSKDSAFLGKIVVSFLHTFDFPIIRYEIGDVGRWDLRQCACGRGLAMLDSAFGRHKDGIHLPDGGYLTAAEIYLRLSDRPFINAVPLHQIAQVDDCALELRVLDRAYRDVRATDELARALKGLVGSMRVETRLVEHLPREAPGGKFRAVLPYRAAAPDDHLAAVQV